MLDRQRVYRGLLRLLPAPGYAKGLTGVERDVADVLARHRAAGASVAFFDQDREYLRLHVGTAGKAGPVTADTFFRVASISKMLTAMCALRLAQDGLIDLGQDVNDVLPYPVRHPEYPHAPVTFAMLLSHTAGLADGDAYHRGISQRVPVPDILSNDSWGAEPGAEWSYSNLGAGLAACVLESMRGQSFERIMQAHLFAPLGVTASFYPQRINGPMADAFRVMPPLGKPGFDAHERRARPLIDADTPNPLLHYSLAQGNCVTGMDGMITIVRALTQPGYLNANSLERMRMPAASFGQRSPYMRQGIGLFLIDEPGVSPHTIYGHQGNAYGAMHGAFFDLNSGRGMVLLTSGASEAKTHFLSDLNRDLMRLCFGVERL